MEKFDVENQLITIKVVNFTEKHFIKLGYNVKNGDIITIPVKHLPKGSGLKVKVQCAYCGGIFDKEYRKYLATKDDCCCEGCKTKKIMKVSLVKYGNVCSLRNEEIQEKSKKTNMKNLGVQYPFQNKEILKKCRETLRDINGIPTSKQQKYICNLFNGELNVQIDIYFGDILINENVIVEYNGGGHDLSVKKHKISQEEFLQKERIRDNIIISNGYKILKIICENDKLPKDEILLKVKEQALESFTTYDVFEYNTTTQKIVFY